MTDAQILQALIKHAPRITGQFFFHDCRLRQFEGRSTVYQRLKVAAFRYFIARRDRLIDMEPKDTLSPYTDSPACTQSDTDIDIKRLLAVHNTTTGGHQTIVGSLCSGYKRVG